MSSIIIKGMKMPRTCAVCEWSDYLHPNAYCRREQTTVNIETAKTSRPEWCPLVVVPAPHGRLGDVDKLMMSLADWWYSSFGEEETDEAKAIRKVLDTVEQSIGEMTVVEAEGRQ